MLKLATLCCLVAAVFAVEGVIEPGSTEQLDEALRAKIDELTKDLVELIQLLNQDTSGNLLYRENSRLEPAQSTLDELLYELENVGENDSEEEVEVEIIEITEVEPDEESEYEIEEVTEIAESNGNANGSLVRWSPDDLEGRANGTDLDARAAKAAAAKKNAKKTKLTAAKKGNKSKSKQKLTAGKNKNKNKKTKLSTKKKIIKKTKLTSGKNKNKGAKTKLSAKETKLAMKKLSAKEAKNICNSLNLKSKGGHGSGLRGLEGSEETPKTTIATTLQQLTEAFNKLQVAISQVSRGSTAVTPPPAPQPSVPSVVPGIELGPGLAQGSANQGGDASTLPPHIASNLASVLSRVAAASVSTTANPLDPIVKAAISVQGQAANALRGILPSDRVA